MNNMDFSTYEEWSEKYSPYANPEASVHWYTLMSFFEAVGQRVKDGTMEVDAAISSLSDMIVIAVWEKSLPIFDEWRKRFNSPSMMNGFELLYNEIMKMNPHTKFIPNPQRQRLMQR